MSNVMKCKLMTAWSLYQFCNRSHLITIHSGQRTTCQTANAKNGQKQEIQSEWLYGVHVRVRKQREEGWTQLQTSKFHRIQFFFDLTHFLFIFFCFAASTGRIFAGRQSTLGGKCCHNKRQFALFNFYTHICANKMQKLSAAEQEVYQKRAKDSNAAVGGNGAAAATQKTAPPKYTSQGVLIADIERAQVDKHEQERAAVHRIKKMINLNFVNMGNVLLHFILFGLGC